MATELERLLVRIDATTETMRRELKRGEDAIQQTQRQVERSAGAIEQRFKQIGVAAAAYLGAKLTSGLLDNARAMQQLEARLNTATGSIKAGAQAMQFLQKMSSEQSIKLEDLAGGFTRLLPSVKSGIINFQQMQDVLRLTNDNIKAFGLSTGEAQGLFLGLSQVLGSGTVTMEDMRQVTDRLPGTFNRMAQEMGMSVGQLKDFIATGKVTTEQVLPAMLQALQDNEGAAEKMGDTFESAMIRMDNSFNDLAIAVTNAGFLDAATMAVQRLTDAANVLGLAFNFVNVGIQKAFGTQQEEFEASEKFFDLYDKMHGLTKANTEELEKLSKSADKVTKSVAGGSGKSGGLAGGIDKAAKAAEDLQKSLDEMQASAVYDAITMGMDEQAKATYDVELELEKLEKRYGTLTEAQKKQAETIIQQTKSNNAAKAAIKAQEEAAKKLEEQAEENRRLMEEPYINAMKNIQNVITDTFEGVFDGSIDSAADAASAIKKIFFRMAAEMATLQIFGAQGLNLAGAISGTGGGLNLGNLSSIGSSAMNLFGGGNLLGSALDRIGGAFGIGEILPWSGNAAAGTGLSSYSSLTNGSWGGSLGGAAGGFVGNFGANALFGQRGIGADIGGTIGGIAGSFIPVPVLGPMIGSFIGNAIGGMFGNKEPSSFMQTGLADLEEGGSILERGGLRGKKFSQENQDKVDVASQSAALIARLFGVTDKLSVAVSQRYGFEYARTDDLKVFDTDSPMRNQFKDAGKFLEAIFKDFADEATRKLSDAVKNALPNIKFDDAEQAIADIQFLQQYEELINPITALEAAMKALDKQFKPVIEQAKRLGLPLERINELYKQQKEAIEAANVQAKIAEIDGLLSGIMDKQLAGLNEQARAATDFVSRFSRIKDSFTTFIAELTTGRFSPLHPVARLNAMRENVESLGARAQLGDEVAAQELRDLLPAFLELSGEVNGFNTVYAQDRDRAEALSKATLAVFTRQVSIQEGIAQAAASQIQVLQDGFNRMIAALQSGRDVFTQSTSNAAGRNLNEVTANGLTVGQTEAIYRAVTGYTGATGAGQLSAAVAAQGKQAEVIAAMKAAGAKGFATGGLVTGGGGVDTIPAMLTSGEFVVNRAAASRIGMGALQSMNSGGGSSLDGKMDSLIRITASLVKVTAESGNVNAEMLAGVQGQLADMQRSQRLTAAG